MAEQRQYVPRDVTPKISVAIISAAISIGVGILSISSVIVKWGGLNEQINTIQKQSDKLDSRMDAVSTQITQHQIIIPMLQSQMIELKSIISSLNNKMDKLLTYASRSDKGWLFKNNREEIHGE